MYAARAKHAGMLRSPMIARDVLIAGAKCSRRDFAGTSDMRVICAADDECAVAPGATSCAPARRPRCCRSTRARRGRAAAPVSSRRPSRQRQGRSGRDRRRPCRGERGAGETARRESVEEIGVAPGRLVELFTYLTSPGIYRRGDHLVSRHRRCLTCAGTGGRDAEREETVPLRVPIDAALATLAPAPCATVR